MSDWPATSCSSAVPGPRRMQSLKGCMGALPHMFQWNRMLGSNNKCIATTAEVQTECFATEIKRWANQVKPLVQLRRGQQLGLMGQAVAAVSNESAMGTTSSSVSGKEADRSVSRERNQRGGIDLRQVLHAKQEPFVLQDVIREKRQPTRTHSSRELKFGAPSSRRSLKMKNSTSSKDQKQVAEDGGSTARYCVSPKTPTGSAAVVRRNCKVPVESMVAMPSCQAPTVYGVNSQKAHSKTASQGRNPVKSPNKRALLMEAAARILEGSNRRTSKRPSTSVRSLLKELEKSKHLEELPNPKEKLVRAVVLHSETSEKEEVLSPNVVILGEKAAQKKQHQNSYALNSLGKHNSNSSCKHPLQMPQILEKDLLFTQNRVFPYENALGEGEVLPSLATAVQTPSEHDVQLHDEYLWSGMKETQNETMNQTLKGFELDSSDLLLQPKAMATVHPEVIITEDEHITELDHSALLKNSRAIVLSAIDFTCLMRPNFDNGLSSRITRIVLDYSVARHFTWAAAVPFPVNKPEKSERSSARSTVRSLIEGADETGHTYCRAREMKASMEAERQSSAMQLRLCNYSWWAAANSHQNSSPEKCDNQLSSEYGSGYESPVAARNPCFVKVWNAEREDFEEEACVCVDEFQQASPVSVLEPVYNEELEVGKSFDHFEEFHKQLLDYTEARQKLLEKVKRYEMLAYMDVDMLKKVSEEQVSYAWDDDDNESWGTDDSCSSSSSVSPAQYSSDVECGKRCEARYVEESLMYDVPQEVEMRSPTSFTRKLEPRPISCRVLLALDEGTEAPQQSQRLVIVDDHIKEVGARPSSSTIVAYMVNSLLHKDLTTSNWSSSKQEEELEVELERCFFDLLMCELLADLLFKPFCNAFDFNGKPVHANCSQC